MDKPQALFFDVNETLLDLGDLKQSIGMTLGGREDLVPLWFRMMLHYSLVHTVADQYRHFGEIGVATLQMLARNQGLDLPCNPFAPFLLILMSSLLFPYSKKRVIACLR